MKELTGFQDVFDRDIHVNDIVICCNRNSNLGTLGTRHVWKLTVIKDKEGNYKLQGPFEWNGLLKWYCMGCYGGPPEIIGNIQDHPEIIIKQNEELKKYYNQYKIA